MPEFVTFLDAVTRNGERTRRVIYVLLLMLTFDVAFFTRFVYPDWNGSRLVLRLDALDCYDAALQFRDAKTDEARADIKKHVDSSKCHKLLWLMAKLHYPLVWPDYSTTHDETPGSKWLSKWDWFFSSTYDPYHGISGDSGGLDLKDLRELDDHHFKLFLHMLEDLGKKEYDDLAVGIPIIGAQFDANDFWLFSGVFMCVLFQILRQHLEREWHNLDQVGGIIPNNQCRDLIVMEAVLTASGNIPSVIGGRRQNAIDGIKAARALIWMNRPRLNRAMQLSLLTIMMFLPPILNTCDWWDDLGSNNLKLMAQYNGEARMWVQYFLQSIFVVALWYICLACFLEVLVIRGLVAKIEATEYPA
jgi:hypothetical protein